jgi:stearoyl-CoA desaturase (delta-9 desaturase)
MSKPALTFSPSEIDWVNTLFLFLTPLFALGGTAWWVYAEGWSWIPLAIGFFFYILSGLSITAGYHRLFAHKAYEAHPFMKIFFLCFGAGAFQNSALKWSSDHRVHHAEVDTEDDPYNINEGFFHAHMGWVMLKKHSIIHHQKVRDLEKDKLVSFQHRYYLPLSAVFGMVIPMLMTVWLCDSWIAGFFVSGWLKVVLLHHCTFFINSLCHYFGSTPYTDKNSAKDSWYMALFTFGEGYHNFHHLFQNDYRNGVKWYHFDPSKWLIKGLSWFGLASRLKTTPLEKILQARIQMRLKNLRERTMLSVEQWQELEKLKTHLLVALENWQNLKTQMREEKKILIQKKNEIIQKHRDSFHHHKERFDQQVDLKMDEYQKRFLELKARCHVARAEFEAAMMQAQFLLA